jgi:hypothetical protein
MPDKTRRLVAGVALKDGLRNLRYKFNALAWFVNSKNQQLRKLAALYAA